MKKSFQFFQIFIQKTLTSFPVASGIKHKCAPSKASSIFIWINRAVLKILPNANITKVVDTKPIDKAKIKLITRLFFLFKKNPICISYFFREIKNFGCISPIYLRHVDTNL